MARLLERLSPNRAAVLRGEIRRRTLERIKLLDRSAAG